MKCSPLEETLLHTCSTAGPSWSRDLSPRLCDLPNPEPSQLCKIFRIHSLIGRRWTMVLTEVGLLHLLVPGLQREVYHLHTNFRYAKYFSYFAGKLELHSKETCP